MVSQRPFFLSFSQERRGKKSLGDLPRSFFPNGNDLLKCFHVSWCFFMFEDLAAAQQTQTLMKRFNEMKANFFSLLMTLSFSKSRPLLSGAKCCFVGPGNCLLKDGEGAIAERSEGAGKDNRSLWPVIFCRGLVRATRDFGNSAMVS